MPVERPLDPDSRDLYGALLRPPAATVFDSAVATTYSLDFDTALSIPVTLTLFASENREEMLASPLTLLEGLERNASRLMIFCDASRIQARPKAQSRLCTLLENTIVEVAAPKGGAFHPKFWLLRYRPLDTAAPTHMRLLIMSRNLTCDRSWDLSLCLDGQVSKSSHSVNRPLVELVRQLPSLPHNWMPDHAEGLAADLSDDLLRTVWVPPAPFDTVSFAVNGLGRNVWRPDTGKRMAILSPFCDDDALGTLADLASDAKPVLIGRPEELVRLTPHILDRFESISVLEEGAETEDGEDEEADEDAMRPLKGLHAKAFIQEIGWDTALTIGSGNATRPALITGHNVEVFATLTGKRAKVGSVDQILDGQGFGRILRPFKRDETKPPSDDERIAEERLEQARRELARAKLRLRCHEEAIAINGQRRWSLILEPALPLRLDSIATATAWPITRGEAHGCDVLAALRAGVPISVGEMALVDLTRFLAFRLVEGGGKAKVLFSLGMAIDGLPPERHQAILRSAIDSRDAFLRYLRLLLADLGDPLSAQLAAKKSRSDTSGSGTGADEPILEDMVRALSHGPDRLKAINRLMERLTDMPAESQDGQQIIPEEFSVLWQAFQTVLNDQGGAGD